MNLEAWLTSDVAGRRCPPRLRLEIQFGNRPARVSRAEIDHDARRASP